MSRRLQRRGASVVAAAASAAVAVAMAGPMPATAARPATAKGDTASPFAGEHSQARVRKGFFDARAATTADAITAAQAVAKGLAADLGALRRAAGPSAEISIDPVTGTPSNLASLDGYLTGRSTASPDSIVRGYLADHTSALGLTKADLATFGEPTSWTDNAGITHLSYTQSARGITVFGNGLRAHVAKDGRLIAVQGSPVPGLVALTARTAAAPKLTADAARSDAAHDVGGSADSNAVQRITRTAGTTLWSNGDRAALVWFVDRSGAHLGWSTYTQAGNSLTYSHVIDASNGRVLYRNDLVDFSDGDAKVYDYYPGAARGGSPKVVNFYQKHWIGHHATWLSGSNVAAWADINDDNRVSDNEKTPVPGNRNHAQFNLFPFDSNSLCSSSFLCTWDPDTAYSWRQNEKADVTNGFYLANTFHDWLAKSPIGFTSKAGNFQRSGGDPVLLNALDGANTDHGLPDGNHIDNANMSTPPDGTSPTMQMYLWHSPGAPNSVEPYVPMSGAFDASILYHEYTHGLSNRLVVDAQGNSTLNSIQAGAMGEAWSDYYAMDYLVAHGFQADQNRTDGQIREGKYPLANKTTFRTEAMDCDPRSTVKACTDIYGNSGGYTYGDFPTIGGSPEVHSSGEVWAQTLWDIREHFGSRVADLLITRAMSLSPADPSMLDMRNAIFQADKVVYNERHSHYLWRLFAHRGMGWFAGSLGAGDTHPAESFKVRPGVRAGYGTLAGRVIDRNTGQPIANALVSITGHDSGYVGSYSDTTDASGRYQISNVRPGTYRKVVVLARGYEGTSGPVTVRRERSAHPYTVQSFKIRRDYAASSGGGRVTDYTGPDYSAFGCGPGGAVDLSQGTGWGSTTGDNAGDPTATPVPKYLVVRLPRAIDIGTGTGKSSAFAVDPTAVCGDAGSSSLNTYRIEASADGTTWTRVVTGTGSSRFVAEDRGRYNNVAATTPFTGARFIRFTMLRPQVFDDTVYPTDPPPRCPGGAFTGCSFMDMTELEVFGTPTTAP
ncbi:MAG: M36 family metallopeptidase [Nocardioidaceae bacterium]